MAAMNLLSKLLALIVANQSFADNSRLIRTFFSNLAAVLGLLLALTMLTGTLIVGSLYAGYLALLAHGWTNYEALSLLGGSTALITLILAAILYYRIKRLRQIPRPLTRLYPPIADRLVDVGHAFVDGLMQKP